jgi:hypothetical protein
LQGAIDMSEKCKHEFKILGGLSYSGLLFFLLWNVALLAIVAMTIYLYQFYWIVLVLLFSYKIKANKDIYCPKCGEIRRGELKDD